MPALRLGPDIDPLRQPTLAQLLVRDAVCGVGVVGDAVSKGVATVVEEEAAACDTVRGPVMDAAFVVGGGADDVGAVGVVVEGVRGDVGELWGC